MEEGRLQLKGGAGASGEGVCSTSDPTVGASWGRGSGQSEWRDKVVSGLLEAVCLLWVILLLLLLLLLLLKLLLLLLLLQLLLLLLLLLDNLPDLLLQLWGDNELVIGVRLGRGVEVPAFLGGSVRRHLYQILAPPLARYRAVGAWPATQRARPCPLGPGAGGGRRRRGRRDGGRLGLRWRWRRWRHRGRG